MSQGRITKSKDGRLDRYRLRWNDVKYQPGTLRVVVYDENGKVAGEKVVRTAGKAHALQLIPETQSDMTKVGDLLYIQVNLVDENGTMIPDADDALTFEVEGAGKFHAVCNGDATSLEPFTQPQMQLFHGQLVLIVKATSKGNIVIKTYDKKRNMTAETRLGVR